jgi:hypothetical protein
LALYRNAKTARWYNATVGVQQLVARLVVGEVWDHILGFKIINEPATRTLLSFYPEPIRQWITRNGGLGIAMMYLSGPDLMGIYRPCR